MSQIANYSDMVLRSHLRDTATNTPMGAIWCGGRLDVILTDLSKHAPVRSWSVVQDDRDHWHAYITMRTGLTYHGRAVEVDSAMRNAIGELLVAEVEV
jgi:hypothetical protein